MLLHLGHRYQCPLCGKNTTSVQNLQFHLMALHWGDRKNFTCRTCGKKFALKKQLREHDRVHSGNENNIELNISNDIDDDSSKIDDSNEILQYVVGVS